MKYLILFILMLLFSALLPATEKFGLSVKDGVILYHPDKHGNRIIDFSYCGYGSSEKTIPNVPVCIKLSGFSGDASSYIQQAIDRVSQLKPDANGFRGAVLLDSGTYFLGKALRISTSGVVLKGRGLSKTKLVKQGYDRGAVIYLEGINNRQLSNPVNINPSYVPVNAFSIPVDDVAGFKSGDRILIFRPSTAAWIKSLGCDEYGGGISALGWKPGDVDMYWDRMVVGVEGNCLIINAPLPMSIGQAQAQAQAKAQEQAQAKAKAEAKAKVMRYQWSGRISESGVENLALESDFNRDYPMDEDHAWTGISVDHAAHCWVRNVQFRYFAGNAVILQPGSSNITVENCISEKPVSEIGGWRRQTFLTLGQLNLFQRCWSENGMHDFAAGYIAPGPNAFVQCRADNALGFSGAVDSWAPGLLFDIVDVDGHDLRFYNQGQAKNGAGWGTANSLFWQCSAAEIMCFSPSDENINRAYGCWAQFSGDGLWEESNNHVQPRSLFYAQLQQRLKKDLSAQAKLMDVKTDASSSPTAEVAAQMSKLAQTVSPTLKDHILKLSEDVKIVFAPQMLPEKSAMSKKQDGKQHEVKGGKPEGNKRDISSSNQGSKKVKIPGSEPLNNDFSIQNGQLFYKEAVLRGARSNVAWWSGKVRNPAISKSKMHLTRFVPGREGVGLTDRIDSVITSMQKEDILLIDHNYGLWYDRRRDDHERIRRRDGDAWAPFYEQPFARSGVGKAWDGLSKYDLTRPNQWYWSRMKEYATQAQQNGKLLFNQHFFQHNILEAGAHWVDCPWRSANNINQTDFPEPVNFAGDKRIFVAEMFYDVNHPHRLKLYENYIRQHLNAFADNPNVVHLISAEYTGPLAFVQFWLRVIADWEKETGKNALVALSTTKDVQDAILADNQLNAVVDIIDIRYWHYGKEGSLYAPQGGKQLAPRQHARLTKVPGVDFNAVYRAVSEYKNHFPQKMVCYSGPDYPGQSWAAFMAGGAFTSIPVKDEKFLRFASKMTVSAEKNEKYCQLVNTDTGFIIYSQSESDFSIPIPMGKYVVKHIHPANGVISTIKNTLSGGKNYNIEGKSGVYWFEKK